MKKHFLLLLLAVSFNHLTAMDSDNRSEDELDIAGIVARMMPKEEFKEPAREAVVAECSSLVFVRPPQFYALQQQGLDKSEIVAHHASEIVEQMRHAANYLERQKSPQRQQLITAK